MSTEEAASADAAAQRRAVVLLVLTAVLWSAAGPLIKWIEWDAWAIAGTRSAIAAVVLMVVVRRGNFTWSTAQIGGAVAYAVTVVLFVVANKWTTASNAILLQYTAPLWIALFSPWFLGERVRWFDWIIMAAIFCGIRLFFVGRLSLLGFWGNVVALVTGVSFAWVALFLRKQKSGSPMESVFMGNVLAAATGLGLWVLLAAGGSHKLSAPDMKGWAGLMGLGVFQLGLSYILYAKAIRKVTALEAMLIPAIEPILNPVLVFVLFGERPGSWALVGGVIVLAAVTVRGVLTALVR